jgi:alkylated DNA repair dioxygenase AlkB
MIRNYCALRTAHSDLNILALPEEWVVRMEDIVSEIDNNLVKRPKIMVFGKECEQNRSVGFFSNESIGYKYSGKLAASQPLTDNLSQLMGFVNEFFNADFNGILINKYEGGDDYISAHSDDEHGLSSNAGVIALSVGAVRTFRIRDKKTGAIMVDVPTNPDMMIQMCGNFQKEFTHEIPKQKRVHGVRYSLTFRRHLE